MGNFEEWCQRRGYRNPRWT